MECLRVGYEAPDGDLSEIKSEWLRYNHELSKEVKAMTVDKRSGIYKSVCACAPKKNAKEWRENTICKAHLFIYKNKVTSVSLEHHCTEANPGRKRQYSVAMIALASDEIRDYDAPTQERGTAVQKYAETAKAAGFELGKSQAYKVIQRISQEPLETHIGQYFLLTSVLKAWKRLDVGGTYEMDTIPASWNENLDSFQRLYVAPSFAKHAWKHCQMRLVTLNASFRTGGHFSHVLLLAVTYDANDDMIILAMGLCDEEKESNWVWFMQNLMRDFPGIQLVLSSSKNFMESTELNGLLKLIAAQRCWCIRRLMEACPEKLSKSDQVLVIEMAKASTSQLYRAFWQNLHKENTSAAMWFDSRKDLFASHVFLESGKRRFEKVEDNVGKDETICGIVKAVSERPIATLLVTYMYKWVQLHTLRKEASHRPQQQYHELCPVAYQDSRRIQSQAAQHVVQVVFNKKSAWKAYVSFGKVDYALHRMLVFVDGSSYDFKCPCQKGVELGRPCVHAAALMLEKHLNTEDARWFHERYHSSTQSAIYNPPRVLDYSSLKGKLNVEELTPPEQSHASQIEKRKNYSSGTPSKEPSKICGACGKKGHHPKTCQNPSTEYQFERFATKARKWAGDQRDLHALR